MIPRRERLLSASERDILAWKLLSICSLRPVSEAVFSHLHSIPLPRAAPSPRWKCLRPLSHAVGNWLQRAGRRQGLTVWAAPRMQYSFTCERWTIPAAQPRCGKHSDNGSECIQDSESSREDSLDFQCLVLHPPRFPPN